MKKEELKFFIELLAKTQEAYDKSQVKKDNPNWSYSITATRIIPQSPLIVGFNWGAAQDVKYRSQDVYPLFPFGKIDDLGSMVRMIRYFKQYCPEALGGMQTNFCFFRSKEEADIGSEDLKLSTPLFEDYLEYARPTQIITFSSKLKNYMKDSGLVEVIAEPTIKNGNRSVYPMKAELTMNGLSKVPVYYLPHPNSAIEGDARKKCWEMAFRTE